MNEKDKKRGQLGQSRSLADQPQGTLSVTMTGEDVLEPGGGEGLKPAEPGIGAEFPGSGTEAPGGVEIPAQGTHWLSMKLPSYQESYQKELSDALDAYKKSQQPFTYHYASDPNYVQYAQTYVREGQRAARDALGQVSARTGGLASSYAASAATQAESYYAQQLADKIPELRQLAYRMYQDELSQRLERVELYTGLQDRDRNWFVTSQLEPFYRERAFDYGVYRDDVADRHWQQDFDYQKQRDEIEDFQWQERLVFDRQRAEEADRQWQESFNYKRQQGLTSW